MNNKEITDEQKKEAIQKLLGMALGEAFKNESTDVEDNNSPMVPGHFIRFCYPDSGK